MRARTITVDGRKLHERFALYNKSLYRMMNHPHEREFAIPVLVTDDPQEICNQVGGVDADDASWCVETFWADETDEFVDGSDYDTATHHYKLYHEEA